MKRALPTAAACVALATVVIIAPAQSQVKVGAEGNGWSKCEELYLERYPAAFEKFGGDATGRNLVDDGALRPDGSVEEITDARACTEAAALGHMLNPPPPPEPEPVAYESESYSEGTAYTAPAASTSSGGMGCVGMEAESGSTGYATDTGNGYIGCYQIGEFHYAPGGICAGGSTDPAGQDACAAAICEEQGAGAWTNAAGANPC